MSSEAPDKKSALADHLRQSVLTLVLQPGSDLDEVQLASDFGVSRTPLREVLQALVGEGYLTHRANRGVRVADLSHTTLRSFFQSAPMIYKAVLQLAAETATQSQIANLKAAQFAFSHALQSGSAADRALANNRFHEITGQMADNPYLIPSFHRLLIDHARIGMTFYQSPNDSRADSKSRAASDQHDAIIASIECGDADAAGQLALDHWALSRGEIERYVLPDGLSADLGAPTMTKRTA